jgi:hypothetical protein
MLETASLSTAFLIYVGLIVAGMLQGTFRGAGNVIALGVLAIWLAYAGAFSWFGLLRDPNLRPPGAGLLVGPVFTVLIIITGMLPAGRRLAASFSTKIATPSTLTALTRPKTESTG